MLRGKTGAYKELRETPHQSESESDPYSELALQGTRCADDEAGQPPGFAHMHPKSKAALKNAT